MDAPPSPGFVKINFDGSVNDSSAAGDFVVRNEYARPLVAATNYVGKASVPTAEEP